MSLPFLSFKQRSVLITGGASGIGRATALAFAEHGAAVTLGDVDVQGAAGTARPEEIASMVLYLCSPAASCVNARVFLIDGGQTAH